MLGGALGLHTLRILDQDGGELERFLFKVDCETEIEDAGGRFKELLAMLHNTMNSFGGPKSRLFKGKVYNYFVWWIRDHVHTLKGMKYFDGNLKSAIELFRDSQREDGMIWDLVEPRTPAREESDERFEYDNFVWPVENGRLHFKRIPVENDVEYLYVEGIYYTWKATGDDGWMEGMLDSAIKAFDYTQTSPYRWSKKYNLLKRAFTIDTWDFQSAEDAKIAGNDIMAVYTDRTRFGIMHGDNTGFAASCKYLSEMLEYVGRTEEAQKYRRLSDEIKDRIDKLAWNGRFYTHHIPEDETVVRDLGVDQSTQLSLSNAYGLNRTLTHEQCVSIIKEYLKIKENLPHGSPGEWYTIYPPFEWGFEEANVKWEYMNGGVTPIVAGELAHGAFRHGYEEYGVDILKRIHALAKKHGGHLHCCFKGALPKRPPANYTALDLSDLVNARENIPGWKGAYAQGQNEIPPGKVTICGIPFHIADPKTSGGKTCIGLHHPNSGPGKPVSGITQIINGRPTFVAYENMDESVESCAIEVGRKAKSLFFLHTLAGNGLAGDVTLEYADGSTYTRYIQEGREILNWWLPKEPTYSKNSEGNLTIAWEGKNDICGRSGLSLFGMRNPYPEAEIRRVHLNAAKNGNYWAVLGLTLSDGDPAVKQYDLSYGIPDNWGAAAIVYGLLEGLAGAVDRATAFEEAELSPRWEAAGVDEALIFVKYPASGGYVAYQYQHDRAKKQITIHVTGSGRDFLVHCLMPKTAADIVAVEVNGNSVEFTRNKIENSLYADFSISGLGHKKILLTYR